MKNIYFLFLFLLLASTARAQADRVAVEKDASGMRLTVNGESIMVNGVNWDYVPIGTTITDPGIWDRSDDIIMAALDDEMALLKNMCLLYLV